MSMDQPVKDVKTSMISSFTLVAIYFVGLLLGWFPPLIYQIGETQIFRLDWFLSVPLIAYVLLWKSSVRVSRSHLYGIVFLFLGFLSFLVGQQYLVGKFLSVWLQLFYLVVLYFALSNLDLGREPYRRCLRFLVLCLLVISLHTFYEAMALNTVVPFVKLYSLPHGYIGQYEYFGYVRPSSIFGEPTQLATLLVIGMGVLTPIAASGRAILFSSRNQKVILGALSLALLLSGSFAGYLMTALAFVGWYVIQPSVRRQMVAMTPLLLVATLVFSVSSVLNVDIGQMAVSRFARLFTVLRQFEIVGTNSISLRFIRLLSGLRAVTLHPLIGTGSGQYAGWVLAELPSSFSAPYPVSRMTIINGGWALVLTETGVVGLGLFSSIWLTVIKKGARLRQQVRGIDATLTTASMMLVVVSTLSILFNFSYVTPFTWAFSGLALAFLTTRGRIMGSNDPESAQAAD
jgi:hypothetical protein